MTNMKFFMLIIFCAAAATGFVIPEEERVNGENGWYVPRTDGSFEWVNMNDAENKAEHFNAKMERLEGRMSTNPVTFYLYTRANPEKEQIITRSRKSIDASNFNAANPTRIAMHGWRSSKKDFINYGVRDAWLSKGLHNFIFVDWGRARSVDYASSTYAVAGVGKEVAKLVDFLVENYGLNLDTLEIIGHSLGAHVAGFTGKNIKSGKAQTIIGLDPALPLFSYSKPHTRLSNTDANYVEAIHTNGDKLGFLKPIAIADFYPNGGKMQPGCSHEYTGACSHSRSITYYVEAVKMDNYYSVKCENYKDAVGRNCGSAFSSIRMAANINAHMVAGEFFVPVNKEAPYGMLPQV